jgi:hypothetical protein
MKLFGGLLFALALYGCNKHREDLPPATHEGKNILGCYINGELFVCQGKPSLLSQEYVKFAGPYMCGGCDSSIWITARKVSEPDITLTIGVKYTTLTHSYLLGGDGRASDYIIGGRHYNTDSTSNGYLRIDYLSSELIAGTFAFDAYDSASNSTIHVTDGRFDIGSD